MKIAQEKKTSPYDVLIIGAGPAGAAAARTLVKNGRRVLVIDKKSLPRYKVCSGMILDRAQDLLLERFGAPPETVFCRPSMLNGVRLSMSGVTFADLPLKKKTIYNVWRSEFDHWLVMQSGAELRDEHRLIRFHQTETGVHADIADPDGALFPIDASYMIGTDGGKSLVRRSLDPAFEKKIHWSSFVQDYCYAAIDLDPAYYYMFFDPSLSAFYTWLHFKDDFLIYGVGAAAGRPIDPTFRDSTRYLGDHFGLRIDSVKRRTGCMVSDIPLHGRFHLGANRVLLAGEAAGFMNVFGEGISSALATGHMAAVAVCRAGESGQGALAIYSNLAEDEKQATFKSWESAKTLMPRIGAESDGKPETASG